MTLIFKGKTEKEKGWGNEKTYLLHGLEQNDLKVKVSADYSSVATEIATIAKALIDSVDTYIYYTSDSIPVSSVTFKTKYDNVELAEALDELADRIDGVWNIEPDGLITLQKITIIESIDIHYAHNIGWGTTQDPDWTDWTETGSADFEVRNSSIDWVGWTGHRDILFSPGDDEGKISYELPIPIALYELAVMECWFMVPAGAGGSMTIELKSGVNPFIHVKLGSSNIYTYTADDGETDSGTDTVANQWYHLRIEWTRNGAIDFFIDGISIEDSKTVPDNIVDNFNVLTANGGSKTYVDAVAIKADDFETTYEIGDNEKGLCGQTKLISNPKYERTNKTYNYIHLYGRGYIESDGDSKDEDDILLNGKEELIRYYPGCNDLVELKNIAASLIQKDGIATPPLNTEFIYKNVYFKNCARNILFTFDNIDRLSTPTTYILKGISFNLDNSANCLLTNSTFQEGREYD